MGTPEKAGTLGKPKATHESFVSYRKVRSASNRSFGLVLAGFFTLIGLLPVLWGDSPRLWALVIAAPFLLAGWLFPAVLAPLNRFWLRLGLALHHVTTPLLMAILYYGTIVPTGLVVRAFGHDPLRLKPAPKGASYWIRRQPPGPEQGSMSRQY